ncbi:MAG: phage holin family protein [Candidatus Magasanikbacteria bacterium]|jgi:putative membrane protein|nr:phage holin family protein [Candidatus Magasanikbacteria bacterium]MBT5262429.1 phage holin family protein [Candidatus Magasanikbacteria bacterium]MBT5820424.1 phage holin family protein [Candidatus Magasanikbacteria bacterium]MBT6294472.1 phage holin family protein [Candidatus Magasanikbacteria bacterium]
MNILIRWAINAMMLLLIAQLLPGIMISGWYAAFITILILGLVNAIIRPIVLFFTLPINILSLGLFTFVVNGFLFWFVSTVVKGFEVSGFVPAFIGALLLTLVSGFTTMLLERKGQI